MILEIGSLVFNGANADTIAILLQNVYIVVKVICKLRTVFELNVSILAIDEIVMGKVSSSDDDCVIEDGNFLMVHSADFA